MSIEPVLPTGFTELELDEIVSFTTEGNVALAESVIGLFKTEVIRCRGPWRNIDAVEYATLVWIDWFNNRRLLEPIGYLPPAEYEREYYRSQETAAQAA